MTNAIYFKASWLFEFDPELIEAGDFESPSGPVSVPIRRGARRR